MSHAAERSIRYRVKLSYQDCRKMVDLIREGRHSLLYREPHSTIIHSIVRYEYINFLAVYDEYLENLVTLLPPKNIERDIYYPNDYFFRDGRILHFNEILHKVYFQLFREHLR